MNAHSVCLIVLAYSLFRPLTVVGGEAGWQGGGAGIVQLYEAGDHEACRSAIAARGELLYIELLSLALPYVIDRDDAVAKSGSTYSSGQHVVELAAMVQEVYPGSRWQDLVLRYLTFDENELREIDATRSLLKEVRARATKGSAEGDAELALEVFQRASALQDTFLIKESSSFLSLSLLEMGDFRSSILYSSVHGESSRALLDYSGVYNAIRITRDCLVEMGEYGLAEAFARKAVNYPNDHRIPEVSLDTNRDVEVLKWLEVRER